LARFDPSPPEVVQAMLEIADVKPSDVVYDLGCGDGRIVIEAAALRGARGVGIDLDSELLRQALESAEARGVAERVSFRQEDLVSTDLSDATVVMLFLSRRGNARIESRLRTELPPDTRVVSHCHPLEGWPVQANRIVQAEGRTHTVYLYRVVPTEAALDLAPFVPSPMPVVDRMLELAEIRDGDVVYDLGCGDGRIVVAAAKRYGVRAVGIDFDLRRCEEAKDRAEREGVADLVEIRHDDIMKADFSDATVVCLYLLPTSNALLREKLRALRPGTRIVAHNYGIEGREPDVASVVETRDFDRHVVFRWVVR
jgi:ubiquinone/menaquinone biosynthesis C-methylase UbiE